MFKLRNDVRFIEYPKAESGQYSIKIEYKRETKTEDRIQRNWLTIGYITKKFSKEENKYIYSATDSVGNQLYPDTKELYVLKQEFRTNGKQLAENAQLARIARMSKANKPERATQPKSDQRNQDIKKLRENKGEKLSKQEQKAQNLRTEKQLDAKNAEKAKETTPNKTESDSKDHTDDVKPDTENPTQPVEEHDIVADRMDELSDIREQDNDVDQDIELDM